MRERVKKFWGAEFGSAKTGSQSKAQRREEGAISLFIVKTRKSANAREPPLSSQSELYIQAVAARSEGEPFYFLVPDFAERVSLHIIILLLPQLRSK
jgi:hypothetical protein